MEKKLILLELNEINFDVAKLYINDGENLRGFKKIFESGLKVTNAESAHENLEPWIQWPSVHTGKRFDEHRIFRLGDIVNSNESQLFEKIENNGYEVGAISPMNASNKLNRPSYFIPDPWTNTPSDNSFVNKILSDALSQAVNDNSQSKISFKSIISLIVGFLILVNPMSYLNLTKFAISSLIKPWRKALFLDLFLYEINKTLLKRKNPNFAVLFLNAGAHIQHHYFFNSKFIKSEKLNNPGWYINEGSDPILDMLKVYDKIIYDLLANNHYQVIIATGLSQKPYEQLKYYYRLRNHETFLKKIGVDFESVHPRMTRDFLVSFKSKEDALKAEKILSSVMVNNEIRLFGKIDNRGKDIFVVLNYSKSISKNCMIEINGRNIKLEENTTFVAIKNGEHQSKGFAFFSRGLKDYEIENNEHVCRIHNSIMEYFCKQ